MTTQLPTQLTTQAPGSAATQAPVLIHADHAVVSKFGDWTTARQFDVRLRRGQVLLDLRTAPAEGDIEIRLSAERGLLKLLVPDDARIDHADLQWQGRGRVKDYASHEGSPGRTITITGTVRHGEIRVYRAGLAIVVGMFSRGQLRAMHRAHQQADREQRARRAQVS